MSRLWLLRVKAGSSEDSTLDAVEARILTLGTVQKAIDYEIALMRCALHKQKNDLIPISTLPTEVLSHVISFYLDASEKLRVPALHRLAQVSKRWRSIVTKTPSFWTRVDSLEMLSTRLKLSQKLPVDFVSPNTKIPMEAETVFRGVSRKWRSICCHRETSNWLLWRAANNHESREYIVHPPNGIERLCIGDGSPSLEVWRLRLAQNHSLRHLDICKVGVDWAPTTFANLTFLAVRHCPVPTKDYGAALDSCQVLQELHLQRIWFHDGKPETPRQLSQLKRLSVTSCPSRVMEDVMDRVDLEQIEDVEINVVHREYASDPILPQRVAAIKSAVMGRPVAAQVGVSFHDGYVEITYSQHLAIRATNREDWRSPRSRRDQSYSTSELYLLNNLLDVLSFANDTPTGLYLFAMRENAFSDFRDHFPHQTLQVCYVQVAERPQRSHYKLLLSLSWKDSGFLHLRHILFEDANLSVWSDQPTIVDRRFASFFCQEWAESRNMSSYDFVLSMRWGTGSPVRASLTLTSIR